MTDYTVIKDREGNIQSITRNKAPAASIPTCVGNADYAQYLEDVATGATVDEVVSPEPSTEPTETDRIAALEQYVMDKELGLI